MFQKKKREEVVSPSTRPSYAVPQDFCRIFTEDQTALYLLSLLLTADSEKAERCFVAGLESSIQGNAVFKEWARSWSKRTIITNAVRMILPAPTSLARCPTAVSSFSNASANSCTPCARSLAVTSFIAMPASASVAIVKGLASTASY